MQRGKQLYSVMTETDQTPGVRSSLLLESSCKGLSP